MPKIPHRPPGRRTDAEAQETRWRILATSRRLFADSGFDAVGLRDIAAAAGMTHGLLRHHFGSKEAIWRGVVDAAEADYREALAPYVVVAGKDDALEVAERFLRQFVAVAARNPDLLRLLIHEGVVSGPRLDYALRYIGGAHHLLVPLIESLHARGLLLAFDSRSLFHFLLFVAGAPFALPALSDGVARLTLDEHADRLVLTLLGQHEIRGRVLPKAVVDGRSDVASIRSR